MNLVKKVFPLLITLCVTYVLSNSWGTIPPFGKFLSPFHGFWVNAEAPEAGEPTEENLQIPGLQKTVKVVYSGVKVAFVIPIEY